VVGSLVSLLTAGAVAELAGPRSYARGVGYHHDDRVEVQLASDCRVEALVRGTMPYWVCLWVEGRQLDWSCSCPIGEDEEFCKHCVAVALVVSEGSEAAVVPTDRTKKRSKRRAPAVDLAGYLSTLDVAELVELLVGQADADWRLRERLVARAAAEAGSSIDEREWRRRLDVVFAPHGDFVPYREAVGWAGEVGDVIDALGELVDAGHATVVIGLAERAHRLADAAVQYVDDSGGELSEISARLGELHLRACVLADPDRVELAGRLVDLELTSDLDAFHRAAATYAVVLGGEGLEEYRRLVEPKWRKLRTAGSADDRWSTTQYRVREAMIGVALGGGDPDDLVTVKKHDLRSPADYLEVAESLRGAGRNDDAIAWARRGLDAFPERSWQTPPVREFLAGILRDIGDVDGAVELFWQAFESHPSVDAYRRLLTEADLADQRVAWSDRAIDALRAQVAECRREDATARPIVNSTPAVALIEILLFEGDSDAAWETATTHGCASRLWLTLARAREREHPDEVIPIYEREAFGQIDTKKNQGYRNAVDLLDRLRSAADRSARPEQFSQVIAEVRSRHKPKRNLMALLDQRGW